MVAHQNVPGSSNRTILTVVTERVQLQYISCCTASSSLCSKVATNQKQKSASVPYLCIYFKSSPLRRSTCFLQTACFPNDTQPALTYRTFFFRSEGSMSPTYLGGVKRALEGDWTIPFVPRFGSRAVRFFTFTVRDSFKCPAGASDNIRRWFRPCCAAWFH